MTPVFGICQPGILPYARAMKRALCILVLLFPAVTTASPEDALRIRLNWERQVGEWTKAYQAADQADREQLLANRPDPAACAERLWREIGPALGETWTLESAAWLLRLHAAIEAVGPLPAPLAKQREDILKAVETRHHADPKVRPLCMALVSCANPRALAVLETIVKSNRDPATQGLAALGAAMVLRNLGDDPALLSKRLTLLRKAIIDACDLETNGTTVAKIAEDELHIIRHLSKGRAAPELAGTDSGGRPLRLSELKGKVVMLLFWNTADAETAKLLRITADTAHSLEGKPFVVLGVASGPVADLRAIEAEGLPWRNLSDPEGALTASYRIRSTPTVFVLDRQGRIQFGGNPGSFATLTAEALLAESPR
jgi:peroxiredoxin